MRYLQLESKVAAASALGLMPGVQVEGHGGGVTEQEVEDEEKCPDGLELAADPLQSPLFDRKANGLDRKQEARAESEKLGECE